MKAPLVLVAIAVVATFIGRSASVLFENACSEKADFQSVTNGATFVFDKEVDGNVLALNGAGGYALLDAIKFQKTDFTINMKFNSIANGKRQVLFGDWYKPWQFLIAVLSNGKIQVTLRRNINSAGSDPNQDLISVTGGSVQREKWQDLVVSFEREPGTCVVYLNGEEVARTTTKWPNHDIQLNTHPTYQVGYKADSNSDYFKGRIGYMSVDDKSYKPDEKQDDDAGGSCAEGWTSSGNRCYKYFGYPLSFSDAEKSCVQQSGHLTSINSPSEYKLIGKMTRVNIKKSSWNTEGTWTGMIISHSPKVFSSFKWTDGSDTSYRPPGTYNNKPSGATAARMMTISAGSHSVKDMTPNTKYAYICEKEMPANDDVGDDVESECAKVTVVTGSASGSQDDAVSAAKCPAGYVGKRCTCDGYCDGSYFVSKDTCHAIHRYGGGNAVAKADCIKDKCVKSLTLPMSPGGYASGPSVSCPSGSSLQSCSIHSPWSHSYKWYMWVNAVGNTCKASNDCKKCRVQAVCLTPKGQKTEEPECTNKPDIAESLGSKSGTADDAESTATCPKGFIGTSCKCSGLCDGSYFINQYTCAAYNRYRIGGVKAKVVCVEKKCVKDQITLFSQGWVAGPSVSCAAGYNLQSCSIHSLWSHTYKYYMEVNADGNTCKASNECKKCRVQAVCIAMNGGNRKKPACADKPGSVANTGALSGAGDDDESITSCPTGYVGKSCVCSPAGICDGSYFINEDTCVAVNRHAVKGVKAMVTCLEKKCVTGQITVTSQGWVAGPSVKCTAGYKLQSCSVHSPWSHTYKYYMSVKPEGNTCKVSKDCKKCRVQAVCMTITGPLDDVTQGCTNKVMVVKGAPSTSADDAVSTAACPVGFVGKSCECYGMCDGSYFLSKVCHAIHRHGSGNAVARVECIEAKCVKSLTTPITSGWTRGPSVSCPSGSKLQSCSIHSPWSHTYRYNMWVNAVGNTCKTSTGCSKCRVQAVCMTMSATYKEEAACKAKPKIADATGAKSRSSDDAESTATCQAGFVGKACKCDSKCDGSYFINQGTCVAVNRYRVGGVKAKVTCVEKACVKSRITLTSDGWVAGPTVSCPKDSELVSCSIHSPWSHSYSSYMTTRMTGNTCVGPSSCKKCRVQAVCISMNEEPKQDCAPGYKLDEKADKCVDLCPDYQQKWDGKKCVQRCIASEKWDGEKCVLKCPLPNKYNAAFKTCEKRICCCYAAGDPNYIQYDGQKVEFMGKCKYTFTKLRGADNHQKCYFNVEEKNVAAHKSKLSFVKLVDIQVEDMTFRYNDETKKVYINGIDNTKSKFPMTLKTKQGTQVIVSFANRKFTVDASDCGMITSYRDSFIETNIKSSLGKMVEGICGTCNGEKRDDLIGKGMKKSGNFIAFSSSWSVPDDSGLPAEGSCKSADVNGDCTVAWATKVMSSSHCGYITDKNGPFKACIASGSVDVQKFKESCEYDVCSASKGSTAAKDVPAVVCKTLAAFADACAAQGAGSVWRSSSFCPLKCEANEYYSPKKYVGCEKTCKNRMVSTNCAEGEPEDGCTCKNSYVRLGNKCVHPKECGCEVSDGQHLDSGEAVVMAGCKAKYECTADSVLKKVDFPACHDDATCSVVKGVYACKCNDGFDGNGHDCKSKCPKAEEKWDTKSSKCILRCPEGDTKWDATSSSCVPRCPDVQTRWDGKKCALRCPNQDDQWSNVKSACIPRCPDVNTKWDQKQGKCVDRCAGHMQWDSQQKKCTSRCAAADKWEVAKKICVPRCPSHQDWKTDECKDKCPKGEKWHDPTQKCFQDIMYPKTEGGNGEEAACVIPFLYGNKWQEDCVQGEEKVWCSTTENYDKDEKWGYCPVICRTKAGLIKFPGDTWTDGGKRVFCNTDGTIGKITGEFSLTTGGNGGGAGCEFPYLYNGYYHGTCLVTSTKPWCGTVKDSSKWGYCPPQCFPKDGSRKNAGDWWMEGKKKFFCDEDAAIEQVKDLSSKTKEGVECVFPFKYNSKYYGECTGTTPWCATTADYDADEKWGDCAVTCLTQDKKNVIAGTTWSHGGKEYACGRDGKVRENVKATTGNCFFPFSYEGETYEKCTETGSAGKPWCYTDEAEKAYGYC